MVVSNVQVCFTWLLWKCTAQAIPAAYWHKKKRGWRALLFSSEKNKKERGFFFFNLFFHVEWLNFTLHWHIWGDAPWNQSNSGISEELYFENSRDMWSYYFLLLWTDCTIMWQLQKESCDGGCTFLWLINFFFWTNQNWIKWRQFNEEFRSSFFFHV